jgi:putative flippase GtrA
MNDCEINERIKLLRLNRSWVFVSRLIRFAIVGFSGVFVDLGGFYFLHTLLGLALTPSAMLSTEVAIINNFLWNDVWTFGDVSDPEQLGNQRFQRFLKFNLICLFGLILNILIVNFLVYKFGMNEYMAKLVAIICVTFWNFGINLRLNWQVKKKDVGGRV